MIDKQLNSLKVMKTIVRSQNQVGGSLLGEIPSCPIKVLTKLFGNPSTWDYDKVEHEWTVSYQEDGKELQLFRIYDYYGDRWHIGGEATHWVKGCAKNKYLEGFIETLTKMIESVK